MTDIRKIGIIGIGNVGATIAYTLMESKLFSEMVLIDLNAEKAHGEAMDLNHCLPFLSPMQIYSGNYNDLNECGIVIIAAGVGQKPGETRIDLLQRNTDVLRTIMDRITTVNPECILLVVTNPVDILTYVSLKLSDFPSNRVIGSGTVLDTARLKYLIGEKLDVDPRNVHSFIIGEHGDSEFAVWSGANVSGINLPDYCPICDHCGGMDELYSLHGYVKDSAYEIIRGKGATYYAIAQATKRIVEAIVRDENTILPVSTYLDGQYGLSDICMSIPAVIGRCGVKHVLDFPLSDSEHTSLMKSAELLKSVAASLTLVPS